MNKCNFLLLALIGLGTSCVDKTTVPPPVVTSQFIHADTANRMITSYLSSIHYNNNDTDLWSVSFDAQQMRLYLADTTIKHFKIMMAHSLDYINSGNEGQYAGYKSNAITFIIAGYTALGNYVFFNDAGNCKVVDRGIHCPTNCPPGEAASPTFQTINCVK